MTTTNGTTNAASSRTTGTTGSAALSGVADASDTTQVLSVRVDGELLDRLHEHAGKRGMSVQDYVVRTLARDDFDQRFAASVDATERFYGAG